MKPDVQLFANRKGRKDSARFARISLCALCGLCGKKVAHGVDEVIEN